MASVSSDSAIEDNVFEKSGPGEPLQVDESDMNGPLTTSSPRGSSSDENEILENFRKIGQERTENDEIERRIFDRSKNKNDNLDVQRFIRAVRKTGLKLSDPRLTDVRTNLDNCQNFIIENVDEETVDTGIDFDCFKGIIGNNSELLTSAFDKQFVISEFDSFQNDIRRIYNDCSTNIFGCTTNYTKYLSSAPSQDDWGVSICSVDGQRCGFGSNTKMFTMQALANPFLYAAVLGDQSHKEIHQIVGQESSGVQYNTIRLDKHGRPHNPMINAGAILMASQYKKELSAAEKHNEVLKLMKRIAGLKDVSDSSVGFDYAGFMSERANCNRNASITYFMREKKCFPDWEKTEVNKILDIYTQIQNITVNCDSMSVMAATLANGGICPITGEAVLGNEDVKASLSCMLAAGMNDYSGQWAYKIGLPGKSGISGGVIIVVPNVMGIALYSPKIEKSFNSVRGLDFALKLVNCFHFHEFDPIRLRSKTVQQTVEMADEEKLIINLIAAQRNDLNRLTQSFLEDFDLNMAGYDEKTPLHVAASHGNMDVVAFLVSKVKVDTTLKDRYGHTATDLAKKSNHQTVYEFLLADDNIKKGVVPQEEISGMSDAVKVLVKMIRAKKARKQTQVIHPLAKMIEDKYPKVAQAVKQADNYSSSDTSNDQIEALSDTKDQAEKSTESGPSQFKIPKSSAAKSLQFNDSDGSDSSSQDETDNKENEFPLISEIMTRRNSLRPRKQNSLRSSPESLRASVQSSPLPKTSSKILQELNTSNHSASELVITTSELVLSPKNLIA